MTKDEFLKIFNAFQALNPDELDCVEFVMNLEKEYGTTIPDEWIPVYPFQAQPDTLTDFEKKVESFIVKDLNYNKPYDNEFVRKFAAAILDIASDKMVPKDMIYEYERKLNDKIEDWRYDGMAEESVGLAAARDILNKIKSKYNV